jgi:hypothetical protein
MIVLQRHLPTGELAELKAQLKCCSRKPLKDKKLPDENADATELLQSDESYSGLQVVS